MLQLSLPKFQCFSSYYTHHSTTFTQSRRITETYDHIPDDIISTYLHIVKRLAIEQHNLLSVNKGDALQMHPFLPRCIYAGWS